MAAVTVGPKTSRFDSFRDFRIASIGVQEASAASEQRYRIKSKAGRRVVGVPDATIPALRDHLSVFVKCEPAVERFPARKASLTAAQPRVSLVEARAFAGACTIAPS